MTLNPNTLVAKDNAHAARFEEFSNRPAFPIYLLLCPSNKGMTIREYYIGEAIKGLMQNPDYSKSPAQLVDARAALVVDTIIMTEAERAL